MSFCLWYFPSSFPIGTQAFSGSNRQPCTRDIFHETEPISFLEQSSKKEFMVESSALKDKYLSKGTLKSKEIQVQSYPNSKIFVTDSGCHIKAFSKTVLNESDIHWKDLIQKGKLQILPWLSEVLFWMLKCNQTQHCICLFFKCCRFFKKAVLEDNCFT